MWDEAKSRRFDELRRDEARRALTEGEQTELAALTAEVDAEEARALQPAIDRAASEADALRAEKARADARVLALANVVDQQEKLLAEAHAYAERIRQRRAALRDEYLRLKAS